jgi:exosortase A
MNASEKTLASAVPESLAPTSGSTGWRTAWPLLVLTLCAIVALYWPTALSIVAIWDRSETFAHGFLIVPIVLYLLWTRRKLIALETPVADWLGAALLALAGVAWLVANAGKVQVVQQFAFVAMIPAAVIAIAGRRAAWAMAFPLAFLFLGVPVGEGLIPPLMDFTADFTVAALKLSGIPVYREGTFFMIPSGQWSVVEGCSGLRYLIASITVGTLYAYLSYQDLRKRVIFIAMSVIVPIIANGLRAYMIVMIAHLSDMKLALGIDHLIYGWVFFGIVMLLLFWIGSYWRDPEPTIPTSVPPTATPIRAAGARPTTHLPRVAVAALVVAIAAAWPLYAAWLDRSRSDVAMTLAPPAPGGGWTLDPTPITDWRPRYFEPTAGVFQTYRNGDRTVVLYLGHYRHQVPNSELVTSQNIMVAQKHPVWQQVGERLRTETLAQGPTEIKQTLLRSPGQRLLIWDWYRISDRDLSNRYVAKLLLARDKLFGRGDSGTAIIVATPYEAETARAEETLRAFLRDMQPAIHDALRRLEAASSGKTGGAP